MKLFHAETNREVKVNDDAFKLAFPNAEKPSKVNEVIEPGHGSPLGLVRYNYHSGDMPSWQECYPHVCGCEWRGAAVKAHESEAGVAILEQDSNFLNISTLDNLRADVSFFMNQWRCNDPWPVKEQVI